MSDFLDKMSSVQRVHDEICDLYPEYRDYSDSLYVSRDMFRDEESRSGIRSILSSSLGIDVFRPHAVMCIESSPLDELIELLDGLEYVPSNSDLSGVDSSCRYCGLSDENLDSHLEVADGIYVVEGVLEKLFSIMCDRCLSRNSYYLK
jgi:hypothetical protein